MNHKESFDVYKSKKGWINPSLFKSLHYVKSPFHFLKQIEKSMSGDTAPTKGMSLGTAIHDLFLEGKTFNADAFTDEEAYTILQMSKSLATLRDLYLFDRDNGTVEQSIYLFAKFGIDGEFECFVDMIEAEYEALPADEKINYKRFKTRPDYFHNRLGYGFDLKSTKSADPIDFRYEIEKYGYHVQAAITMDALEAEFRRKFVCFYFFAVENVFPFASVVYECSEDMIAAGRTDYRRRLAKINRCLNEKYFPSYGGLYSSYGTERDIVVIDLPKSYYYKNREF